MLYQTREEHKRWDGVQGTSKQPKEGAMQKPADKKKSRRDMYAPPQTREERRKCFCSFLCWQIGAGSSVRSVGWEWDEMALSFRADVRSFSPAGRWRSSRQVRGCAGWRFLSGAACVCKMSLVISHRFPVELGTCQFTSPL